MARVVAPVCRQAAPLECGRMVRLYVRRTPQWLAVGWLCPWCGSRIFDDQTLASLHPDQTTLEVE